jgi:hypothetical protein
MQNWKSVENEIRQNYEAVNKNVKLCPKIRLCTRIDLIFKPVIIMTFTYGGISQQYHVTDDRQCDFECGFYVSRITVSICQSQLQK